MDIKDLETNRYIGQIFIEWIHILDYWENNAMDEKYGGFYGKVNYKNVPEENADKGIILNARILWTFSNAYRYLGVQEHLRLAERSYQYLIRHFVDKEFGGVYWSVDYKGNVVSSRKQIYAQAFAIYSLVEYYIISKDEDALRLAQDIFHLVERHSFDPEYDGYLEAFDREWKSLDDVRLSEKDMNALKTMNTHLHVLEAYTSLYGIWKDEFLNTQLENLIQLFKNKIIDSKTGHLHLFFNQQWNLLSTLTSFGHDIEASWLLYEAAEVLGDMKLLKDIESIVLIVADAAKQGIDKDGGLMNELNYSNQHLDDDKHWWPQAEAMVGFMNAYLLSGRKDYFDLFRNSWVFISRYIIDQERGEWYWKVDRDGKPSKDEKIGFWKCPYHNSRACMEILKKMKMIQ
ncbi:MAG: AGE family epimerase/isomerase [Bacteroidales bacterium]|nr:AGE family epimerase/isomerase [Bacteroidales bacterium]